jgi:phage FluMu protein Com
MSTITMRAIRPGEVPPDGGTALQDDPGRPVFRGNGPDDYVCVGCGNVLASGMDPLYMTKKVRVKCGRCKTVNVAITDESPAGDPRLLRRARLGGQGGQRS